MNRTTLKKLVPFLIIALLILHQDFWWWDSINPLIFGFMPIGLAYHAGISIAAAFVWWLATKSWWTEEMEVSDAEAAARRQQRGEL
ncbi:MAG TPA: DUF3311 domain-containing protein [Phycisphaerae bacterium]|nr:DUF3311 domain-containing protein [Phycisphaerae bacterium]